VLAGSHLEKQGISLQRGKPFHAGRPGVDHKKTHIFPANHNGRRPRGTAGSLGVGSGESGRAISMKRKSRSCRILPTTAPSDSFVPRSVFGSGFWRVRHCAQARCIENQITLFIAARSRRRPPLPQLWPQFNLSACTSRGIQMASLPRRQRQQMS